MTTSFFLRQLLWKEYRQQREFWLALLVCGFLLQLILSIAANLNNSPISADVLVTIALLMPIFFASGAGAVLFAGEHDAGTYSTLQSLPVSADQAFVHKAAIALLGIVTIPIPLLIAAYGISQFQTPAPLEIAAFYLRVMPLIAIELFAWSIFFSLQTHRPLLSIVLSIPALIVVWLLIAIASRVIASEYLTGVLTAGRLELAMHVVATSLLLLDDVWLARGWFAETPRRFRRAAWRAIVEKQVLLDPVVPPAATSRGRIYSRLLWHEWKQSRGTMALIFAVFGGLSILMLISAAGNDRSGMLYLAILSLPFLSGVLGGCVYFTDQSRSSYRYFAEHGVSARQVWLSRHLLWGSVLLIWVGLFLALIIGWFGSINATMELTEVFFPFARILNNLPSPARLDVSMLMLEMLASLGMLAIVSYCAAQVASLYFRSGIVGLFVGMFLSLGACSWVALMSLANVPWLLSIVPVPILCLWATWLRAPDWIIERTSWRARLRAAVALASPAVLALTVIAYRVLEIPAVAPPIDYYPVSRPSDDARKTRVLYLEALNDMWSSASVDEHPQPSPDFAVGADATVANANVSEAARMRQIAIDKFLAASNREECYFDRGMEAELVRVQFLVRAVLAHADKKQAEGGEKESLDGIFAVLRYARRLYESDIADNQLNADWVEAAALEQLVQWAGKNRQQEEIRAVIERLRKECLSYLPARDNAIYNEVGTILATVSNPTSVSAIRTNTLAQYRYVTKYMPWEKLRNERIAANYSALALDELRRLEANQLAMDATLDWSKFVRLYEQIESSLMLSTLFKHHPHAFGLAAVAQETHRRAALIRLVILSTPPYKFRIEEQSPDPYSKNPFTYFANGTPMSLIVADPLNIEPKRSIAANTPFIWSQGPHLIYVGNKKPPADRNDVSGAYRYAVNRVPDEYHPPVQNMRELLERGLIFLVPQAPEKVSAEK